MQQAQTNMMGYGSTSPQYSSLQQAQPQATQGLNQGIVTPSMWQDVVQRAYVDGAKRRWVENPREQTDRFSKRAR